MNKRLLFSLIFFGMLIILAIFSLAESSLSPCSSDGLTTTVNKEYQMEYPSEDLLQVTDANALKEVSQLKDLTCLQYLDATDRTIKGDIADLKNLNNLVVFSLYSNPEVSGDICSLAGATKLKSLKFAFDPKITGDVSCLKNLNQLETFAMTHTQISGDVSVFAKMPNLKAIYISGTNIKGDICALKDLANLQELGIADEYPGNPEITGNLSCLSNLKKLTRVALYNTKAANCEQFTKDHPGIEQGGCSKESMKTLVDYAQKYEKKIGKETQTEIKGKSNYQPANYQPVNPLPNNSQLTNHQLSSNPKETAPEISEHKNFFAKLVDWIRGLFGRTSETRMTTGPEGCKTQAECDAVCSKPENKEACSKLVPPSGAKEGKETPEIKPNLETGELGGCKTKAECEAYCSTQEHQKECSKFSHTDEGLQGDEGAQGPDGPGKEADSPGQITASKVECRVSVLPSSKGTAPYTAKICVDNPNERLQQKYLDDVDFEGDGTWDVYQDQNHGCHSHHFLEKGTFYPKAKIIDSEGVESELCETTLVVS